MSRSPKASDGGNLLVRKNDVLCTVCGQVLPIHPGDGTPLPALLNAYDTAKSQHPNKPHSIP